MHQEKLKSSSLDIGEILYITLDILTGKWKTLLLILIIINFPLLLVGQLMPNHPISYSFWIIIYAVFTTLEWLALLVLTEKTILDEKVDAKLALKRGFYKLRTLLVNLLVMWVIYFIFVGFGLILFIIPGIYIAITHYFFSETIALRNASFFDSFQYSRKLVEGNFCKVLLLAFLATTTSGNLVTPSNFLPELPVLEAMLIIIIKLFLNFIFYIIRIVITVSFLNLDYVKNGLPSRV